MRISDWSSDVCSSDLIGGSYSKRDFQSFGIFPDDWAAFPGAAREGMPTNIKYTDYQLERERIGGIASLDWRPSDTTHLWARGIYSKFTENEYRQRFRLHFPTQAQRDNRDRKRGEKGKG